MGKHGICHVEWPSSDLNRTREFYSDFFDWSFVPFGDEYMVFTAPDGGPGGGFWKTTETISSASPNIYIEVDDLEPYLNKASSLGAKTDPIHEVPNMGWFVYLYDPDGNKIGLWKGTQQD